MRNFYTIILALIIGASANAQQIQWDKTFGGTSDDEANCIEKTSDGGYIVVGYSASNDIDLALNKGAKDFWILKLDENGNKQWQKTYGGGLDDVANAVKQTSDGGYIVVGDTKSNDGDVGTHPNHAYYITNRWILKLTSTGNLSWKQYIGNGNSYAKATSLVQANDGGYIIAGSQPYVTVQNIALYDYQILKLSSSGSIIWDVRFGGMYDDIASSIVKTSDGNYVVAGESWSNDRDVANHNGTVGVSGVGTPDFWLIKIDDSGNLLWQNSLGSTGHEQCYSVKQTLDGGYILGGRTYDNFCLIKCNSSGVLEWQKNYGGSDTDVGKSIIQTEDGGYLIVGYSNSAIGQDVTDHHANSGTFFNDFWTVKVNSSGEKEWTKSYGGSQNDMGQSIVESADGGYAIAGFTLSFDGDGDVTNHISGRDFWIAKLFSPTGLNVFGISNTLTFYPNPTSGNFTITNTQNKNIEIVNLTGQLIYNKTNSNHKTQIIDLSSQPKGIYFVKVGNEVRKIIKE